MTTVELTRFRVEPGREEELLRARPAMPAAARCGSGSPSPASTPATWASGRAWGARRRRLPHGDGAGVTDAVGAGVPAGRIGQRVWVFLAQSYRPYGTAAEYVTFPAGHAIPLAGYVPFDQGAVLGIPGITGHRAVPAHQTAARGVGAGRTVLALCQTPA